MTNLIQLAIETLVQFFGATTGFIVNYTPDYAVRFDLSCAPVEELDHAFRPGEVTLTLGGKTFPAQNFFKILGATPRSSNV